VGIIINQLDNKPIPYVNIGIRNKNFGAVSDEKGNFRLQFNTNQLADTLTFSCVGYQEESFPIKGILSKEKIVFAMKEKVTELPEVIVSSKKPKIRKIGIKSHNPFLQGIAQSRDINDIVEIGRLIPIENPNTKITSAHLFLHYVSVDTAVFRINFYRFQSEEPGSRMVEKSIIVRLPVSKGWHVMDLDKYNIYMQEDFFIGIEFLPNKSNNNRNNSFMYGAKLGGLNGFSRNSSLGKWEKARGAAHSLYVTVRQ